MIHDKNFIVVGRGALIVVERCPILALYHGERLSMSSRWLIGASIVAIGFAVPAGAQETTTYQYDALGRLVRVEVVGGATGNVTSTYALDAAGNRTNVTVTGGGTGTPTPSPSCSFAIQDGLGNGEFSFDVIVDRTGTCSGNVTLHYEVRDMNVRGDLTFTPQESMKWFTIGGGGCWGTNETFNFVSTLTVVSGNAQLSRANGIVKIVPNC